MELKKDTIPKKSIPNKEIKLLWGLSGNKCAICRTGLSEARSDGEFYVVGVMAHIEGEKTGAKRYNSNMSENERANHSNLMVLCPTCHTKIDNDDGTYTVEALRNIKSEHEQWVSQSLKDALPQVTFVELEIIIKYLTSISIAQDQSQIILVPPKEKINKNNLSQGVENLIILGLSQVKQVREYQIGQPDIKFEGRLKAGFVNKYIELKKSGLDGDSLFYSLLDFAYSGCDFVHRAAALSVLVYFFEICDIFEK